MTISQNSYDSLKDGDKIEIINKLYLIEKKSFADIASIYDTYPNKVRRDAKALGIKIRDKSEAQKNALKAGKSKHPTKGKKRDDSTKAKIGQSVLKSWDNLDEKELQRRRRNSKKQWEKMSEDEKAQMTKLANDAVRAASKTGSKLEKYLFNRLLEAGYKVDFHKEQSLLNTRLQIDLFLPTINTAIEVDGPSHFLPVWGDDTLKRNKKYDNKKQGLILGKGLVLIRIKQKKDFSKSRGDLIFDQLINMINTIRQNFPSPDNRTFTIED